MQLIISMMYVHLMSIFSRLFGIQNNYDNLESINTPECVKLLKFEMAFKVLLDKDPFLGCTNYKDDNTGCNNMISKEYYLRHYVETK